MDDKEQRYLWGGRFGSPPAEAFERLNASISFDIRLAPYDIRGSIAHARMLGECGVVTAEESEELVRGLEAVMGKIEAGEFSWELQEEEGYTAGERQLEALVGGIAPK